MRIACRTVLCLLLIAFAGTRPAARAADADSDGKLVRHPSGATIRWVTPDSDKYPLPTGVQHLTFDSKAAGCPVGYTIYLPPDYDQHPDQRYPVIYSLHGNGGNEIKGLESMAVLHEGITKGWWPPMIMVRPNGGYSTFYKDSADGLLPIETMFIKEFIPYIDATYRTVAASYGRCIEGFSMGGRGSTRLAIKYPELFCSLFCQAGNVPHISEMYDPSKPDEYPNNYLGPDKQNYLDNDVFVLLEKNLDKIKGHLRIMIACGTQDGGHLPTVRDFHNALPAHGVDHTYLEIESMAHQRTRMIALLKPILFDYHVESMRLARKAAGVK